MEDQFVSGSLIYLLSTDYVEVLCVYASNNNIERRLLWGRLVEISSRWTGLGVVMGDFNAIKLHYEAFGGSQKIWRSLIWLHVILLNYGVG